MGVKSFIAQYHVDFRLKDLNGLAAIANDFDLIGLDRDGTTSVFHGSKPDGRIIETLLAIAPKAEKISNSSFDGLKRIRDIYGALMPVSKMVGFGILKEPHLLRFNRGGGLRVLKYLPTQGIFYDCTEQLVSGDRLLEKITSQYQKPNPLVLLAVVALAKQEKRIPEKNPRVLYVGDKYSTDVRCANQAGVEAARVPTMGQFSDLREWRIDYVAARLLFDLPFGGFMSWLASTGWRDDKEKSDEKIKDLPGRRVV